MGYKYRNDDTPDHVDDISTSTAIDQHGLGDDPKKPGVPVDTVMLKKNIVKDEKTRDNNTIQVSDPYGNDDNSITNSKAKAAIKSIQARNDTLTQARAGKIPAKP